MHPAALPPEADAPVLNVAEAGPLSGIPDPAVPAADPLSDPESDKVLSKYIEDLKRSNRGLEEFAYIASHDLQEPLRKISTFSGRLALRYSDIMDDEGRMYLERIIASADSMRMLMDSLLEYSRLTTVDQPTVRTNLGFILKQTTSDLELIIEETGAVVNVEGLPFIIAVPSQMKQLFTNLLSNAIKFRRPGIAPVITVRTEAPALEDEAYLPSDSRSYHRIVIEDNGIGFEGEYCERIFGIFQRLHGKSEYPGSGVGLAICRKIAEAHGGAIRAENVPGQGARFIILLPAEPA
jgi:light-regulated signal transduction histidine kinase (bacteriophytochrome)